jgi:AcrR family transcriptional regulator
MQLSSQFPWFIASLRNSSPGKKMPKVVDHEERRQELGAAAFRVITRRGTLDISMTEIAKEAGWSRGALEHYVKSRDDLYQLIFNHHAAVTKKRIDKVFAKLKGIAAFRELMHGALIKDGRPFTVWTFWFGLGERANSNPLARKLIHQRVTGARKLYADVLKDAQELGEISADINVKRMAKSMLALLDGISTQVYMCKEKISLNEQLAMADEWIDVMLKPMPRKVAAD